MAIHPLTVTRISWTYCFPAQHTKARAGYVLEQKDEEPGICSSANVWNI